VNQQNGLPRPILNIISNCLAVFSLLLCPATRGWAQQKVSAPQQAAGGENQSQNQNQDQNKEMTAAIQELQQQVSELRSAVAEMRSEAAKYRAETLELRRELQATLNQDPKSPDNSKVNHEATAPAAISLEDRVSSLEDTSTTLAGKVDEQHQVKVESGSKYRVRLSGIVLMNLFGNRGSVDSIDIPSYAVPTATYGSNSNFGATLRQSELGLEVFGPQLAGARTSGSVQFDFSGGLPNTFNGVNFGTVRLRTASMRLDWTNTSVVVGQDNLFFSPLSPSSFASLSIPAFGYAGNLWGWIPQVRVEHRFDVAAGKSISVQGGVLDNLTGQPPYSQFDRLPQAGESSGQPAYASRVAWSQSIGDEPLSLGVAGYYSPQSWGFTRHVDGWAGTMDWNIPITSLFSLSGELYRGRAVGGLGGGIGQSVLYSGDPRDPATRVRGLNSAGGWSQLKFKPIPKLEFNGAFGLDNPFAKDLEAFRQGVTIYGTALGQNRSALLNFILRPRSNLLFSAEYRHFRTLESYGNAYTAEQFNLMMGVLF
jgi:regulator of replication initiation timing